MTPVPIHPILVFDGVIISEEIVEEAIERRRKKEETTEGEGNSLTPALNPTLALVSVCGDISPSLQVMNLEFLQ
jgi:hypothetical protein